MSQWYYADEARKRIGPLNADELREHYRQRRLRRDNLVWCDGMVEWLPLERVAIELDIDSITPDATLPPPLPAGGTAPPHATRRAAPQKQKGMSGCLIALIVCAVVAVPVIGILAAIAIPAYHDYVERAKKASSAPPAYDADQMARSDEQVRTLIERAMATYYPQRRECPDTFEFESVQVRDSSLAGNFTVDLSDSGDQRCAYRVTFLHQGVMVDGKVLRYEATPSERGIDIRCSTAELAAAFRPPHCD